MSYVLCHSPIVYSGQTGSGLKADLKIFSSETILHFYLWPLTLPGTDKWDFHDIYCINRVPTAQGKQGKWPKKCLQGKTGNLEILPKLQGNTGNSMCSSSKFPDFKDTGYCEICHEIFKFLKVSFCHEIVPNF